MWATEIIHTAGVLVSIYYVVDRSTMVLAEPIGCPRNGLVHLLSLAIFREAIFSS